MTTNLGKGDKIARLLVGIAIAGAGIYFRSWWGLLAIIPLGTAWGGYCPLYSVIGFSSAKKGTEKEKEEDRFEKSEDTPEDSFEEKTEQDESKEADENNKTEEDNSSQEEDK